VWEGAYHVEPLREDGNMRVVFGNTRVLFLRFLRSPRAPPKPSRPLATEHHWGVASARLAALFSGDDMIPLSEFPAIDAILNATSALLLTLGYFFIRRKRIQAHKVCMLSAFAISSLFLVCYIWYHAHHGVTRFLGQSAVRDFTWRCSVRTQFLRWSSCP